MALKNSITPGFKIKNFDKDVSRYSHIFPDLDEYLKNDFIINGDNHKKGNVDLCVWQKQRPDIKEGLS